MVLVSLFNSGYGGSIIHRRQGYHSDYLIGLGREGETIAFTMNGTSVYFRD
jgi:hypothetical protein